MAMPEFPPPHTAAAISELTRSTLKKWGIEDDVPIVITDNAAAMIAAFKEIASDPDQSQQSEDDEMDDQGSSSLSPPATENVPDVLQDVNLNSSTASEDELSDSFCSIVDENLGSEDQGADILTEEQVEREIYNDDIRT